MAIFIILINPKFVQIVKKIFKLQNRLNCGLIFFVVIYQIRSYYIAEEYYEY